MLSLRIEPSRIVARSFPNPPLFLSSSHLWDHACGKQRSSILEGGGGGTIEIAILAADIYRLVEDYSRVNKR